MTLINDPNVRRPNRIPIDPSDELRIKVYLRGMVYCWCKNRRNEWFAVRDLLGGENFEWGGTPMQKLFDRHKDNRKSDEDAVAFAGIDAGYLLRQILMDDDREFDCRFDQIY